MSLEMKKYIVKLNDSVYEVEMGEVTGETTTYVAPKAAQTEAASAVAAAKPKAAAVSGAEDVSAPMPGSILDIKVKVGDTVKKGQILLVLEAMKMENEIVSPRDAKIVSVQAVKGETVNPGDVMIQLA